LRAFGGGYTSGYTLTNPFVEMKVQVVTVKVTVVVLERLTGCFLEAEWADKILRDFCLATFLGVGKVNTLERVVVLTHLDNVIQEPLKKLLWVQ
jgi:hypothetical protein